MRATSATARVRLDRALPQQRKLSEELLQLHVEFADADIDIALTFLSLARFDFETREYEHAARLLMNARRASETVTGMLTRLPGEHANRIRARLVKLQAAIGETARLAHKDAGSAAAR